MCFSAGTWLCQLEIVLPTIFIIVKFDGETHLEGRGCNHSQDRIKIKGTPEEPISEHFYSNRKCYI